MHRSTSKWKVYGSIAVVDTSYVALCILENIQLSISWRVGMENIFSSTAPMANKPELWVQGLKTAIVASEQSFIQRSRASWVD